MKPIRVFIALKLPDAVIEAIREAQKRLADRRLNVRWVKAENIHLTLKFLGDIDALRIDDVIAAVVKAAGERNPCQLSAKGAGVFPSIKRARVIWVGIAGQVKALAELQAAVESGLAGIGFPIEKRRFSGHLTLGRSKGAIDTRKLMDAMEDIRNFESEPFSADRIVVYKSELQPTGAVYTELGKVILEER